MLRSSRGAGRGRLWIGVVLVALLCAVTVPADAAKHRKPALSISVLSGRANLVSGGSALVAINLLRSDRKHVKVTLGRRNVTKAFATRSDGSFEGLVTGLKPGRNTLQATLPSGWAARITLVNHPIGGPMFSGPQLKPWTCQQGARDAKCNQPATFSYVYRSTDQTKSGFQPYDPANPPSDVAQTTTDQGVTLPFIVRVETGYMDRDQYRIAALYEPGKPWTPFDPQRQFNHKLLITHGASCGIEHRTGNAPDVLGGAAQTALGRGFLPDEFPYFHARSIPLDMSRKVADFAPGIAVPVLSGGGSPALKGCGDFPMLTEYRAGTYIYNDVMQVTAGGATWDDCAMTVRATVVSRPTETRAVLDSGSKVMTYEQHYAKGFGRIVEYPDAQVTDRPAMTFFESKIYSDPLPDGKSTRCVAPAGTCSCFSPIEIVCGGPPRLSTKIVTQSK